MNISKLESLISNCKLSKQQISDECGFSRTTLDNVINGGDFKISTIKSLAKFFNVTVGYFFEAENVSAQQTVSGNIGSDVTAITFNKMESGSTIQTGKKPCGQNITNNISLDPEHLLRIIEEKDKRIEEKDINIENMAKKAYDRNQESISEIGKLIANNNLLIQQISKLTDLLTKGNS